MPALEFVVEDDVVGRSGVLLGAIRTRRRPPIAVQTALRVLGEVCRRLAASGVGVIVRHRLRRLPLRLPAPRRAVAVVNGVRILRARPAILLLLLLLRRLLARRQRCGILEVGGVVPAPGAGGKHAVGVTVLAVVAFFPWVPQPSVSICARAGALLLVGRKVDAGAALLAVLVRSALEIGAGQAFVVTVRPLGAPFFAFDLGGINETVFLDPLWRSAVILVVTDVLGCVRLARAVAVGGEYIHLDVEVVDMSCKI